MKEPFGVSGHTIWCEWNQWTNENILNLIRKCWIILMGKPSQSSPIAAFITHYNKANLYLKRDFLPLKDSEKRIYPKFLLFQKFNDGTLTCRRLTLDRYLYSKTLYIWDLTLVCGSWWSISHPLHVISSNRLNGKESGSFKNLSKVFMVVNLPNKEGVD